MTIDDPTLLSARLCSVRALTSHRDGGRYELTPVVLVEPGDEIAGAIARVCNEPLIHETLFTDLLGGRAYEPDDARRFLDWGSAGWEAGTHFVYLILDDTGGLAGAIDIKSPDLASAEIGYWLSREHRGVMTNAVEELSALAREAGFEGLYGLVRPENDRSAAVLARARFERAGETERNGRRYDRYERRL